MIKWYKICNIHINSISDSVLQYLQHLHNFFQSFYDALYAAFTWRVLMIQSTKHDLRHQVQHLHMPTATFRSWIISRTQLQHLQHFYQIKVVGCAYATLQAAQQWWSDELDTEAVVYTIALAIHVAWRAVRYQLLLATGGSISLSGCSFKMHGLIIRSPWM